MVEIGLIGNFLTDIGSLLLLAVLFALVAKYFKQPLIGGYVFAGILLGPYFFDVISNMEMIEVFAELGIAFLLFTVGLEIDLNKLSNLKNSILAIALIEVVSLFGIGYLVMVALGFDAITGIYIGLIIAFSSTGVLIKLLMDLGELESIHGRLILGVLLIQDIIVVLAISVLPILSQGTQFEVFSLIEALFIASLIIAVAFFMNKYLVNYLFNFIGNSDELLFLSSIAILFSFLAISNQAGLSTAVGGFIAGVTLANYPFNIKIAEKAKPMRDFFLTIFFVYIGMLIEFSSFYKNIIPFILLLILTMVFKPIIIYLTSYKLGFGNKTNFKTSIGLGQISEFSIVIAILGYGIGQISQEILSLTALLMVVSTTLTSYFFTSTESIFDKLNKYLPQQKEDNFCQTSCGKTNHIILINGSLLGKRILNFLNKDEEIVLVDNNPEVIRRYREKGIEVIYGDPKEKSTLEEANAEYAKIIISTITDEETTNQLFKNLSEVNKKNIKILTAISSESAIELYKKGVDFVINPYLLAAKEAVDQIKKISKGEKIEEYRKKQIEILEKEIEQKNPFPSEGLDRKEITET